MTSTSVVNGRRRLYFGGAGTLNEGLVNQDIACISVRGNVQLNMTYANHRLLGSKISTAGSMLISGTVFLVAEFGFTPPLFRDPVVFLSCVD
jgi:hypothetical protein